MTGDNRPHSLVSPLLARSAALGFLLALWLSVGLPLAAQSRAPQAPTVLVLTRALDSEAEKTFQTVVAESLRLALERGGLAVRQDSRPAATEAAALPPPWSSLPEVEHLVAAEYGLVGSELELRLAWYPRGKKEPSATLTRRGRMDLALDRVILLAAEELLRGVNPALGAVRPPVTGPAVAVIAPPASPPLPPEGSAGIGDRRKRLEIGLGAGPFVTTGAASEYFKLGIMPVLNASFLLRGETRRLGLGLYAGANLFDAEGSLESASALLAPLGAAVRYELGRSSAPLIVLGLSAGPALISMDTSGGERLTGLTVYGRGSLGIRLPVGEVFGIAAEAGYDIYWERPYPIMGFCPAVYASMRL